MDTRSPLECKMRCKYAILGRVEALSCLPRIGNLISLFVIQNSHVVFEMVSGQTGRSPPFNDCR
jgi:hypothetical protein